MARVRKMQSKRGAAFGFMVAIVVPTLTVVSKRNWIDGDKLPADGGYVVVMNHVSHIDPMALGHFLYHHGRIVRYLAKQEIFETPILKTIAKNAGQIPVPRLTTDAAVAFNAAVEAVNAGEVVGVYPEGTITKDPSGWPMRGKTGAARIALTTGKPVIPIGQWGAQDLLPAYSKRPRLWPRATTSYKVGEAVDLSDLIGKPISNDVLAEATDRIMAAITSLVEDLREEKRPEGPIFDPRAAGVRQTGNPNKDKKKGRR